ncbi:MAG TPA: Rieske 2Fe-2S domain-containing protein [Telluria sp.]|nr:Rieske 2Fe-2S domain-containing protein [Telluria sp.]
MADARILVCASDEVAEGGKGVRFPVQVYGDQATGFVVRRGGKAYGYLNRCAHVPTELDWFKGEFFESSGMYIMCQTHGAIYTPETGVCVGGPCKGGHLKPISVEEDNNSIYWHPDDQIRPPE